jgi:hypothetical protein
MFNEMYRIDRDVLLMLSSIIALILLGMNLSWTSFLFLLAGWVVVLVLVIAWRHWWWQDIQDRIEYDRSGDYNND